MIFLLAKKLVWNRILRSLTAVEDSCLKELVHPKIRLLFIFETQVKISLMKPERFLYLY